MIRWLRHKRVKPKFLAQAVELRLITPDEAREVRSQQLQMRQKGENPPRVGRLLVENGVIQEDQLELIVETLQESIRRRLRFPDPVPPLRIPRGTTPAYVRYSTPVFGLVLIATPLIWFFSDGLMSTVAGYASIAAYLIAVLTETFPSLSRKQIDLGPAWRGLITAAGPISVAVGGQGLWDLWGGRADGSTDIDAALARATLGFSVASVVLIVFWVSSAYRRRQIWQLQSRIARSAMLLSRVRAYLTGEKPTPIDEAFDNPVDQAAMDVMNATARILARNMWLDLLKSLLFWKQGLGYTILWFLVPDHARRRFDIRYTAAPGAPTEVSAILREVQQRNHPRMLDEQKFDDALVRATGEDGKVNQKSFLAIDPRERASYVSLTGFVFAKRQPQWASDIRECLAFDHRMSDAWKNKELSSESAQWLKVACAAAFPVFERQTREEPIGVLLVASNVRDSITPDDLKALLTASHVLGAIFTELRENEEKTDEDRPGSDAE